MRSWNWLAGLAAGALVASGVAVLAPGFTTSASGAELLQDGGFEASVGDPLDSPGWTEDDPANGSPICGPVDCDAAPTFGSAAHSGTHWVWFGGPATDPYNARIDQDVMIPSGVARLAYWYDASRVTAPFDALLTVEVDGQILREHQETATADAGYAQQTVDVSGFADGGSHTVSFAFYSGTSGDLALNVDDVSLEVTTAFSGTPFVADPTSLGAIPDPGGCDAVQITRDVTFAVSGKAGAVTDVSARMAFDHPFTGDVGATLIAPGGAASALLFERTGADPAGDTFGDSSPLQGSYVFSDKAPATPTWWQAAEQADGDHAVPSGAYRASSSGQSAAGGANASITLPFAGLSSANGTWILRVSDWCNDSVGFVTDATLYVETAGVVPGPTPPGPTPPDPTPPGPTPSDTTAPDTSFTSSPPGGVAKALKVPFGFASSEAGSTFLCSLDGATYAACASPATVAVASGAHVFRVAAKDAAGNTDATPATASFTAYDCATLNAKVTALKKKVKALKKMIKATKTKIAKAEDAGDKAKVAELTAKLKKLLKKLKRAKVKLAKAKAAAAPCQA